MAYQVEKTTTIGEVVNTHPEVAPILMKSECTALDVRLLRWNLWKKQQWFTELTSNY